MTQSTDRLLTPAQVAERLGIAVRTLETWRYRGRSPRYIRVGKHVRYRPADVDAFLAEHERAGTAG
jgi:excisionase family DNA binding protein